MTGIFLDRDGVIIRKAPEGEYITNVQEMQFLPGAAEAVARLNRAGFKIVVVTNQRGVALGKTRVEDLEVIHSKLRQVVSDVGGDFADILYCPHDISEACPCRKPKAGMLLSAADKHHLRLSDCWMIGDAATDLAAGQVVGCRTVLICESKKSFSTWIEQPDLWDVSLASAVKQILALR